MNAPSSRPPLSQPLLFQWLRWTLFRNSFRALVTTSPVRLITIILSVVLIWSTGLGLSIWGLLFIRNNNLQQFLIGIIFDVMFLALSTLLVFSSGLILFGSLFKGAETNFLLCTPARADHVFGYKFQMAVGLSSMAFLWLMSPLFLVYGAVFNAPWYYYVLVPLFLLGFVLVPGSLGGLLSLLIGRFLPNQRRTVLIAGIILVAVVFGIWLYLFIRAAMTNTNLDLLQILKFFRFASNPALPNHWMTRGLQLACWQQWDEALYYLGLVWSNGLLLYTITTWVAARVYRFGFDRLTTGGNLRRTAPRAVAGVRPRRSPSAWLDDVLAGFLSFVDPQTRVLIIKDFRTFRREPVQWVQVVIFVVLMVLYFSIMRIFYQHDIPRSYQNGVSLLNLSVTGLLMCAYTGRFIFPMLSLEGRKFWLLGLLPLKRDRLLWGKFFFSATSLLLPTFTLIVVSDLLLGMSPVGVALHGLTMLLLTLGLSGLSVGLGACLPNFRETDPSKIAVGFGGTLNLICGLLFLVLIVVVTVGPYHVFVANESDNSATEPIAEWWLYVSVALGLILGSAAVVFPMRLGIGHLNRLEF